MTRIRLAVVAAGGFLAAVAMTGCAPPAAEYGTNADQPSLVNAAGDAPSAEPTDQGAQPPAAPGGSGKITKQLTAVTLPRMGNAVKDDEGFLLYRFDKDTANPPASNCNDKCAEQWPPALTDATPQLTGVDPAKVGTVVRKDGTRQITIGNWPVYRFAGDTEPGKWKGQGVGGTWFIVQADGKKNLSCLPTGTPTPAQAPAGNEKEGNGGGNGGGESGGGSTY